MLAKGQVLQLKTVQKNNGYIGNVSSRGAYRVRCDVVLLGRGVSVGVSSVIIPEAEAAPG